MTDRFTITHTDQNGSRRQWAVIDSQNSRMQGGFYIRKSDAKRMAARWNADHELAEIEAPIRTCRSA